MTNSATQKNLSLILGIAIGGALCVLLIAVAPRDLTLEVIGGAAATLVFKRVLNILTRIKK